MSTLQTARDIAMKGAGYYSKATTGAKDVIDAATPLVLDAAVALTLAEDGKPITVADMGCADGGTSIEMIGAVVRALRARAPGRPIQLVYTDLPRNDFSQVFQNVHGLTELKSPLTEIPGLFIFASGTSFHRAIFPPETLHLGFSATASHYISEKPSPISGHVHMVGAKGEERAAYEAQGAKDWEAILLRRTEELVPGGRLALFNFGIDEEGRYLGSTGGVNMFDTFNEIWAEFAEKGIITQAEYRDTNFAQCYRTVEQFCAPLKDETSPVFRAGLRLEHVETRVVRCPYERDFAEHGDAERFAHEYIPTLRSWSEHTFAAGLSPDRPIEARVSILDRYFDAYEDRVRRNPEGHGMDYVHIYLICSKVE
jgi:indole-3-acetate O-methyltransferase